jgi:drug/metabolite transporter (DMT)-like permease
VESINLTLDRSIDRIPASFQVLLDSPHIYCSTMHERRRHTKVETTPASDRMAISPTTGSKLPRRLRRKRSRLNGGSLELGLWSSRGLLLVVAGMYSTNYASVKYLETMCVRPPCDHDPAEIAFCRFFVSALVCLPILYTNRKQLPLIKAGLECGLSVSINYICQAQALEFIPAGKCCFIATLVVAVVPILNGIFLGKPIKPMNFVSAGVALLGVAILENLIPIGLGKVDPVVTSDGAGTGDLIFGLGKGDLLAMGQPIGFGYSVMRIDYYLEKYSHMPNRVLTITAAQCVSVCVLTCLWLLYDNGGTFPDLTYMVEPHHLIALAWTGVITSVGAIILQGTALQIASATDAALIFCTEPIMASLFAGWLLNETPAASTYVGGFVIIIACVLGSIPDSGGGEGGISKKRGFTTKSSNITDEDSILPTRSKHRQSDMSLPSLADVRDFPSGTPSKVHALI